MINIFFRETIIQPILVLIKMLLTSIAIYYMIKQFKSYKNEQYLDAFYFGGKALLFILPSPYFIA